MGQKISFRGLFALALAGILPVGAPLGIAPIIKYAGPASIWPVLLGYLLVLVSSLPILEYAKLLPFAGGYYGLAELGLGLFVGKYTALMNYIYYVVWQAQNALLAGWLLTSLLASAGGNPPLWLWVAVVEGVLILSYFGAAAPPKRYSEDVLFAVLVGSTMFTIALSLYVVVKSHYNSLAYLSPLSAPPGAIALATAAMGFWLYVGYGAPLFYSEEGVNPTKDVWRAITSALTSSAAVYALSAYSIIAAVPPGKIAALESAPMPMYYAWSSYLPSPLLLSYAFILAPSALAYGGPAGSHARLLWAMARDGFMDIGWLKRLDKGVPKNAALFNLAVSSAVAISLGAFAFLIRGFSVASAEDAWLYSSISATTLWYLHHVQPELGLYGFLRRHPEVKMSRLRRVGIAIVAPAIGTAAFAYTFYVALEYKYSYRAPVYAALATAAAALTYTYYKKRRGELGKSTISYMLAERGVVERQGLGAEPEMEYQKRHS